MRMPEVLYDGCARLLRRRLLKVLARVVVDKVLHIQPAHISAARPHRIHLEEIKKPKSHWTAGGSGNFSRRKALRVPLQVAQAGRHLDD